MTKILDKNLNDIYEIKTNDDFTTNFNLNDSEVDTDYHSLIKRNIFSLEDIKKDFITIIEYNILHFYRSYLRTVNNCLNILKILKYDFDKYINYDNFKIVDIYYNPYLSVFIYSFIRNNALEYEIIDADIPITSKTKLSGMIRLNMDNTSYTNALDFVVVAEIKGVKKYFLILTFATDTSRYVKKPKVMNITEEQYNCFVDYINKHEKLQIKNDENEPYYFEELPEETTNNEDSHT